MISLSGMAGVVLILIGVMILLSLCLKKRCPKCKKRFAVSVEGEWGDVVIRRCECCGLTIEENYRGEKL